MYAKLKKKGLITYKKIYFHFHSTVQLTSSHQRSSYIRRNVTDNNYETPHHYTEIHV